jgi:hypothetical protein
MNDDSYHLVSLRDMITLADIRRWLLSDTEWNDIHSQDMAVKAGKILDAHYEEHEAQTKQVANLRARVAELEAFCRKLYPHTFAGAHPGLGRAAELRAEMARLGLGKADG